MSAPLHGARYAVVGSGYKMAQILALTTELKAAKECKTRSGWDNNPTVKIYELVEVG